MVEILERGRDFTSDQDRRLCNIAWLLQYDLLRLLRGESARRGEGLRTGTVVNSGLGTHAGGRNRAGRCLKRIRPPPRQEGGPKKCEAVDNSAAFLLASPPARKGIKTVRG
jgi:hypothetical protein